MSEQTFTVSNPRKEETIEDWPHGARRVTAVFTHESNKKGERIARTTTGKPKMSKYYAAIRLVDGSDGKTHMLCDCGGFLSIMACDMKYRDFSVFPEDDNYDDYYAMLYPNDTKD